MSKKIEIDSSEVTTAQARVEALNKSMGDTMNHTGMLGGKLGEMWNSFKSGSEVAVKGLTTVKGALAATGIGLLLIAVQGLVNYFEKTAAGANQMKQIMAALGVVVRDGPIVVFKVLKTWIEALLLPFQTIISVWKNGIAVLTGKKSLSEAVKGVTGDLKEHIATIKEDAIAAANSIKALANAALKQADIAKQEAELHARQRKEAIEIQKLQEDIAKQREAAAEEGVSATKKQELYNKALEDEHKLYLIQKADAEEELKIVKEKIDNGDKSGEILDELKDKQLALGQVEIDYANKTRTLQKAETAAWKKEAAEKAAAEKEAEKIKDDQLKRLRKYQEEAEVGTLKAEEKELKALEQKRDDELALENTTDEMKIAIEEAYQSQKAGVIAKYDEEKKKKDAEELKKAEAALAKYNEDKEKAQEYITQLEGEKYKAAEAKKIAYLKDALKKSLISESQYTDAVNKLKKLEVDTAITGTSQTLDAVSDAVGKGTQLGKATAAASTLMKTYEAAEGAYAAMIAIPIVGPVLAPIAAAAAVIAGMKNVQSIYAVAAPTPQKMEYGGWIDGPSHTNGGVNVNAQGGELMMTASAASRNPQIASMVLNANSSALGGSSAQTLSAADVAVIAAQVVKAIPVNINETNRMIEERRISIRENSFTV